MQRFTALMLCLVTFITAIITVYADSIQPYSNNVNSTEVFIMRKYNITTLILMILVCFGPPLNLLFEYFALHQKPSPVLWGTTVFSLVGLILFIIFYIKVLK